jgi:hypothetical protein
MFPRPGAQKDINDGFDDLFLVVAATYLYLGTIIEGYVGPNPGAEGTVRPLMVQLPNW